MKQLTLMTSLGILALSVAATTLENSIYLVGLFLLASIGGLVIRQAAKKWAFTPFVGMTLLILVATLLQLGLSVLEPTLAQHPIVIGLGFQPLLVMMVFTQTETVPLRAWLQAILLTVSAVVLIGIIAEALATGLIFGFEIPMLVSSSFFQTPGGILLITAGVLACTQLGKRGEQA